MENLWPILSKIIDTFLGAGLTILGVVISNRVRRREEKRNSLSMLLQNNKELFSVIFKGATGKGNIDYVALREELEKSNILIMLWGNLRTEFKKLYYIHSLEPNEYNNSKEEIYKILCNIEKILSRCGEDLFEK